MRDVGEEARTFIVARVQEIVAQRGAQIGDIDDTVDLIGASIIDSLGFVELMAAIEEEFDLELSFDDIDPEELTTVRGLAHATCQAPEPVRED